MAVGFNTIPPAISNIEAGRLRAMRRLPRARPLLLTFPQPPSPGCPASRRCNTTGLSAPAGTPRPIVERLNKELRSIIESEEMRKHIVAEGGDPIASTPEEYAANIVREEGKWAALIKKLGLKIE